MGWNARRMMFTIAMILILGLFFAPLVLLDIAALVETGEGFQTLWCWSIVASGITALALLVYVVITRRDPRTLFVEDPEE